MVNTVKRPYNRVIPIALNSTQQYEVKKWWPKSSRPNTIHNEPSTIGLTPGTDIWCFEFYKIFYKTSVEKKGRV